MQRFVMISVETKREDLEQSIPEEFIQLFESCLELPGFYAYKFTIYEENWYLLSDLRQYIREIWRENVLEIWLCFFSFEEKYDASLLGFKPQFIDGIVEHNEPIDTLQECKSCGGRFSGLVEHPRLRLSIPSTNVPFMFYAPQSLIVVSTRHFFDALMGAGLHHGLDTIPVDIVDGPDEEFVALRATRSLGWPVAPYGLRGVPCTVCGNVLNADPLYALYWTFRRSNRDTDWFYWPISGPGSPLMSKRVHSWIRKYSEKHSYCPLPDNWFDGRVYGWYPDEKEIAFLPERYQDTEL